MKNNNNPSNSPALAHVLHVWQHAPANSNMRFNHALHSALNNAITSGMRFEEGDLVHLSQNCRLSYWLGSGEGLYGSACGDTRGTENTSAAIAFEKYYDRKAWLWAEASKTPSRLCIGSSLTWQGHHVIVTSFNDAKQSLVACSHLRGSGRDDNEYEPGRKTYILGDYRLIEMVKHYDDKTVCMRFSPPTKDGCSTKIARRFTITHNELMAARKAYDDRRKGFEKEITAAKTLAELDAVSAKAGAAGTTRNAYRHFDLDILRAAFKERSDAIEEELSETERLAYATTRQQKHEHDLTRWMAGEDIAQHFLTIRVRIRDNRVEVSNGNSVTLEGARSALAFALKHRRKGWVENGETFDVDSFKVTEVHPKRGVTIGCTHFDWPEIERFQTLVKKTLK